MNAPVDVLEVMREAWMNVHGDELLKARAAVVELIAAVDALFGAGMERCMEMDGKEDQLAAVQLAKTALARVKGGAA